MPSTLTEHLFAALFSMLLQGTAGPCTADGHDLKGQVDL